MSLRTKAYQSLLPHENKKPGEIYLMTGGAKRMPLLRRS
jgi:hypothetical protein